ncbi:MAG TPA: DUF47 family protein [Acetobacteraceae bacterium]|nr:DUF47 family protein [Acetobacteraceae bacterium]
MKTRILEAMGVTELQRASGLSDALAANDRVKYLFSLLQMAVSHADHPDQPAVSLKRERLAAGVDDASLDDMVATAQRRARNYQLPGAANAMQRIANEMRVMAEPVIACGKPDYAERLRQLLNALPAANNDCLTAMDVTAITQAGRPKHGVPVDSLHRLVMDLHKELNTQQAALAQEVLDGAAVYGLAESDRACVKAFMAGVNRTAGLKFDHPGLGTTATRAGDRLIIQNDIGTTDAHVIVIHVEALTVTVTYSDVHPERVQFLRNMLAPMNVSWDDGRSAQVATLAAGMPFQLVIGSFVAADAADCLRFLEFLGSRLVFLIDWNKARKHLRGFLRGPQRLDVLLWAAQQDAGHRGFLEIGGARAINQAIEATADTAMHFGDRLCDVLGTEPAVEFVQFVLSTAAQGKLAGQSNALIADRIRAELQRHLSDDERRLLGVAVDHAGLIFEIASLVQDGVLAAGTGDGGFNKRADRARRFEHDADLLVVAAREAARRRPDRAVFRTLLETADDAADHLEDVAFLLVLASDHEKQGGETLDALRALTAVTLEGAQEWIKALSHAAHVTRPGMREDTDDFLTAIDRVAALEHQADDAERRLTTLAIQQSKDFRQLHLYTAISNGLEETMDALKHASLTLRGHVLGEVLGG